MSATPVELVGVTMVKVGAYEDQAAGARALRSDRPRPPARGWHPDLSRAALAVQRFQSQPVSAILPGDVLALQGVIGNRAVGRLLAERGSEAQHPGVSVQRAWDERGAAKKLAKDGKGKLLLTNVFPNVSLFKFTTCDFIDPKDKESKSRSLDGITFPAAYVKPGRIYVNTDHPSNKEAAATLYHEGRHVDDPKTPALEHTHEAVSQDIANEMRTWKKELKYRIRQGGDVLDRYVKKGYIKGGPGSYAIDEDEVRKAFEGSAKTYGAVNRLDRFNPANYRWDGKKDAQSFKLPSIEDLESEALSPPAKASAKRRTCPSCTLF